MTKKLYKLAAMLQQEMAAGEPRAVAREAWACLVRWHEAGEPVRRLTALDVERARPGLPPGLDLAGAPVRSAGMLYVINRREWLLVARHAAREPYGVAPGCAPRAYADPSLTYATELDGGELAAGIFNLRDSPVPGLLAIKPVTISGPLGERPLTRSDLAVELVRVSIALPDFYLL